MHVSSRIRLPKLERRLFTPRHVLSRADVSHVCRCSKQLGHWGHAPTGRGNRSVVLWGVSWKNGCGQGKEGEAGTPSQNWWEGGKVQQGLAQAASGTCGCSVQSIRVGGERSKVWQAHMLGHFECGTVGKQRHGVEKTHVGAYEPAAACEWTAAERLCRHIWKKACLSGIAAQHASTQLQGMQAGDGCGWLPSAALGAECGWPCAPRGIDGRWKARNEGCVPPAAAHIATC